MSKKKEISEILNPKKQLQLFGYDYYFHSFSKLFHKGKLPNTILLSGPHGIGKATFTYHFINYLLSQNETDMYSVENFTINPNNKSYKLLMENLHPNFFLIDNNSSLNDIKIDDVRNLTNFLKKSTFSSDLKIVLIDNAEYLNLNSSNSLLKVLEEPSKSTFFFLIYNNSAKILNTIKSRCIEFKIHLTFDEKKIILKNILNNIENDFNLANIDNNFYFNTPGTILKFLEITQDNKFDYTNDKVSCILYLIDIYIKNKNPQYLFFISYFVEKFYNDLSLKNNIDINLCFTNKFNLLKQIDRFKKFNLDKQNLFISLKEKILNDSR